MNAKLKEMVKTAVREIFEDSLPEILTPVILRDYQDDLKSADPNFKLKARVIEAYLSEFSFSFDASDEDSDLPF